MGFYYRASEKLERLEILKNGELLGYYSYKLIFETLNKKLGDGIILVFAERKKEKGIEYFHFVEAILYLLKDLLFDKLFDYLKYDIRLGVYSDGRPHDHGSGFRIIPRDFEKVFKKGKRLM